MTTVDLGIGPPPPSGLDTDTIDPEGPRPDPFKGELLEADPDLGAADVDPAVIRAVLEGIGGTLAALPVEVPVLLEPDAVDQWRFTDDELDHLTPIITRMVNARPQLRAAAARGDEVALALQLGPYIFRNVMHGITVRNLTKNQPEEWERGNVDRQAPGAPAEGDGGGRAPAGSGQGPGPVGPVGAGVHPAAD